MRTPFSLLIVLATGACLSAPSSATDFFVSPAGKDGSPGTRSLPWRTIQHACDQLNAGDTVHVLRGVYHEKIRIPVSGAAGRPVVIQTEQGATISGRDVDGENIVLIENRSHVRLEGFEIRDNLKVKDGSGIRIQGAGAGIEIRNCRIHEIRGRDAMGITVYGTSADTPLSGIVIDRCEVFNCDPARSEAVTLNGNVSGFQVTNNLVHDVNNIGIDFIGGEDWISRNPASVARNGLCKGNKVFRCRSPYEGGYAAGIYVDGGRNIVIEDNVVTQCDLGIEIGAENKAIVTSAITVRNNWVYRNDKAGIVFGGYERSAGRVKGCSFSGNICYRNDAHGETNGELWIQWASDNQVTGNIFWSGANGTLVQVDPNAGFNLIDRNRYYSEADEDGAFFLWRDQDVEGFAAWRRTSKQDANSVFERAEIRLPPVK